MKAQTDSRGVFNPLVVILIVVVLGVIGFAGWKISSKKDTKSSTAAVVNNSAVESACNKEINDKVFCKFAAHFSLTSSYKSTITSTDDKGTVSKIDVENDTKSNSSMTTKDAAGKETSAFITLDNASYIKDEADGSWTKYTSSASTNTSKPTSAVKFDASDITSKNTTSYKNLGKEACGNLSCYKYQVVDSTTPGTTQYIWFDSKNYQMQRWSSQDTSGSMDMPFSYESVNIKAPSPVKEATSPSAGGSTDVNALIQAAQNAAASGSAPSQ